MKISVPVLTFLLVVASITLVSAGPSSITNIHAVSCCGNKVKARLRKQDLKNFARHDCIVFTTKTDEKRCADPKAPWVKRLLRALPEVPNRS